MSFLVNGYLCQGVFPEIQGFPAGVAVEYLTEILGGTVSHPVCYLIDFVVGIYEHGDCMFDADICQHLIDCLFYFFFEEYAQASSADSTVLRYFLYGKCGFHIVLLHVKDCVFYMRGAMLETAASR